MPVGRGHRRPLSLRLAGLASVAAIAACGGGADGSGAPASDALGGPAGPSPDAAGTATDGGADPGAPLSTVPTALPPGGPNLPTGQATAGPPQLPGGGGSEKQNAVCAMFSDADLRSAFFGEAVARTGDSFDDRGCEFSAASGSVRISIFDYLTLAEDYKQYPTGQKLTVAGMPALRTELSVTVSRVRDPADEGIVVADYVHDSGRGDEIALDLLDTVVRAYRR